MATRTEAVGDAQPAGEAPPAGPREVDELDLGYQVELDQFSGPLDLLLYLVRRAEVDVTDIPLIPIADQFVATVANWEEMDLDVAGDFILMAATLLEIKARLVMPPELQEGEGGDEEDEDLIDPRTDLIRQLLAYRRVKEAVQVLEELERERHLVHERRFAEMVPEDPEADQAISLENADPYQLYAAWEGILKQIAGHRPRTVAYDDIPIEERIRHIERTMREAREGQLSWLLEKASSPVQRCGVVVAVLESIRQRILEASQHEQYGAVYLRYRDEDERGHQPSAPLPEEPEEERPKRRKRRPLVTFQASDPMPDEDGHQEMLDEVDELLGAETDEQRFVRELNEETDVDTLLGRASELDRYLTAHLVVSGVMAPPDQFEMPADVVVPEGVEGPAAPAGGAPDGDDEALDDEDADDTFDDEYDDDDVFDDEYDEDEDA